MIFGAQHGITGDFDLAMPETEIEEQDLVIEKNAARFAKSKEFQALKAHLESRIAHYQTQLPGNRDIGEATEQDWAVAVKVVQELKAILDFYERSKEVVKENAKLRPR